MKNFHVFMVSLFVVLLTLAQDVSAWEYSIDNTCDNCSRRHLDSLNAFHRNKVRVNQTGYRPQDGHKWAMVAGPEVTVFSVVNADNGTEALSGTLEDMGQQPGGTIYIRGVFNSISDVYEFGDSSATTQEHLYRADFSELQTEGRYYVVVGTDTSHVFRIDDKLYNHLFETALKFFGVQRCGDTHSWIHKACHLKDGSEVGHDLTGGWHDCGDHFKVSETLGYSAFVLSLAYNVWPEKAEDFYGKSYNDTLPYGTDGIPDVLWEAKVGADFIYKLYKASKADGLIASGDMYHSVGVDGADHAYWGKPENQDAQPASKGGPDRVVADGIGSNVAGMYAASLALFANGWRLFDEELATDMLNAAIDIYDNVIMPNLGSNTSNLNGFYPGGGRTDDDEAAAALALWFTTKQERFRHDLYENTAINNNTNHVYVEGQFPGGHMGTNKYFNPGGWTTDYEQIHAFVLYAFAKLILKDDATASDYGLDSDKRKELLSDVMACLAHSIKVGSEGPATYKGSKPGEEIHTTEPYHGVFTSFTWGLNRYNLGKVNELFMYWDLSKEQVYFDIAIDNINYNLGMNPWDVSFVMGAGTRNLNHPHNRAANPDGYNAGGIPYEYTCPKGAFMGGALPGGILKDDWEDYVVTETCIDFSAQLLFPAQMLAKDLPPDTRGPRFSNITVDQVGMNSAIISWDTDELSKDKIYVAKSANGAIVAEVDAGPLSKSKVVLVEGLDKNTQYYFYLEGEDIRRNVATDDNHGLWHPFKTTDTPLPAAQFEGVRICNVTHNSAVVYWWTPNGSYQSQVEYGTSPTLGQSKIGDDSGVPGMFHQVTLTGLEPNTTYYLDVISGGSRSDNGGQHYSFKTTEVFIDYTIMMKGTSKLSNSAHFYMEVSNNETEPYDGIELRWYFKAPNPSAVTIKGFDNQLYDVTGVPSNASITYGSPVQMPAPYDEHWYIPITYDGTLPVDGRLRVEMEVHNGDWGDLPFDQLTGSWSISEHSEPVAWEGIDLGEVLKYSGTPEYVETIDGQNVVTFKRTQFVTAHYKGVHVYGYGPDWEKNMPQSHRDVDMSFTSPFQSPALSIEQDSYDADFKGSAWAKPDANLNYVEVGNLDFGLAEAALTPISGRKDSVDFNHSVKGMPDGGNKFTFVAWHNRDEIDCACAVKRVTIEADTLASPRTKRYLVFEPDTLEAYTGKRKRVRVWLSDEQGNLLTDEDMSLSLTPSDAAILFYIDKETDVAMQRITLEQGEAEFYVYSEKILTGNAILEAENPLPDYKYVPGDLPIIILERPPWPIIETAMMFDDDCDLIPDRIEVELSEPFKAGQAPTRLELDWQGGVEVNASSSMINGLIMDVPLPDDLYADGSPSGEVTMFMSVSGAEQSHTEEFREAIGPQVMGMALLEQLDPDQSEDTLYVQFSERVVSPGISWFLNIFDADGKPIADEPTVINAKETDVENNIWMLVVKAEKGDVKQPIVEGVQIQLKTAAEATIMDKSKNTQSDCNFKKHTVTTKYRPVPIDFGEILDKDEDGLAETVILHYTRALDANHTPDSIGTVFGMTAPESLVVADFDLDADKKVMTIKYKDQFALGNTAGTFEGTYEGSEIKNGGLAIQYLGANAAFEADERVIFDKVGPVLVDAIFQEGSRSDSLGVIFSEPISVVDDPLANIVQRVVGDKDQELETITWIVNSDSMGAVFFYTKEAKGHITVGDKVRLAPVNSAYIDASDGNEPARNNPPVVVRGSREFEMELDIDMVEEVQAVDLSEIAKAYGEFKPKANEHFRVTVLNHANLWEIPVKNGVLDLSGAADSASFPHVGPTMILYLGVPTGSGREEAPLWDSVSVNIKLQVYDNLGQYVNSVSENFVIQGRDYLSLNDEVVVFVEWTAQPGKGPVSTKGRAVGTGAYIANFQIKTKMETDIMKEGLTAENLSKLNRSQSFSERKTFGYIRK